MSGHQPLVLMLLAMCTGILLDRYCPISLSIWWPLAFISILLWLILFLSRRRRVSAVLLLAACLGSGGVWHHLRWSVFPANDLGFFADESLRPMCVAAVVQGNPRWSPAPRPNPLRTMQVGEQSTVRLQIVGARDGRGWRNMSGRADLKVNGRLDHVRVGDELRVFALVHSPATSRNPGDFDFARFLRTRRELCRLHGDLPDCLEVVHQGGSLHPRRIIADVRSRGTRLLWRYVDHEKAALASAILLGAREQIDDQQTNDFFTTGTIHLLAISGLHVGILAWLFWCLGRLDLVPRRATFISIAVFVIAYALLTQSRPPVVRATVLIVALCSARYIGRQAFSFNTLAAAALVVLAISPAQLFLAGTQLSFLAVAALACCAGWFVRQTPGDPLKQLILETRSRGYRAARSAGSWLFRVWLTSTLIWLVALPLVMQRFHLVTPIAILLNPLLLIPICVALYSGLSVLVFGGFLPPVAELGGSVCGTSLSAIQWMIELAQPWPASHFWTAGPDTWWVIGFYALLALFVVRRVPRRWKVVAITTWIAIGLAFSRAAQETPVECDENHSLACTIVSVGHGSAVFLEFPDGKTLLYDAGRLGSPSAATRAITSVLWSRGITHLDAVVLSHADVDHYNALPELLKRVSVGVVYVSPVMFDRKTAALDLLLRSIADAAVPIRLMAMNDQLNVGNGTVIDVLHPPRKGVVGVDSDNANSIVLLVQFAGRRILLPGDLVSPGLDDVLAERPLDCDVVMAPHHGSAGSHPARFATWSTPEWVVISAGQNDRLAAVKQAFRDAGAEVLHTNECGAVRITITGRAMFVRAWRQDPW